MEEKVMASKSTVELFNSPLETGVRSVVLLDATRPRSFDLKQLTWLDHLVVHTGDISVPTAPESLHPNVPHRNAELLVRRTLVEQGLVFMMRLHLVEKINSDGYKYVARDEASPFVQLIRTDYGRQLKSRANWLAAFLNRTSDAQLEEIISNKIGRWTIEFQSGQKTVIS